MRGILFDQQQDRPAADHIRLARIPADPPADLDRVAAERELSHLGAELIELQSLLWGARTHSILMVLQGRDAAGKDGTVKDVIGHLNPRGVHVATFGRPTEEELDHDFLWRIHQQTPRCGHIVVFNRSHYEDVLVVRVHKLAPPSIWKPRYALINAFEQSLAASGTIILKCFLHISAKEQLERLVSRETKDRNSWKLNTDDWREREHWAAYTRAYEDAIARCASPAAPWVVVPSDRKWYRNLVVADALVHALRPYRRDWERTVARQGTAKRKELEAYRAELSSARAARRRG